MMTRFMPILSLVIFCSITSAGASPKQPDCEYGKLLGENEFAYFWSSPAGWKIGKTWKVPAKTEHAIKISLARNETEAGQIVITPTRPLQNVVLTVTDLISFSRAKIPATKIDILRVGYVNVKTPTDKLGSKGLWPDPLFPGARIKSARSGINTPFWIRVFADKNTPAGIYKGILTISCMQFTKKIAIEVEVFDFTLPDKMTCKTSFGFNHGGVIYKYHNAKTIEQKRQLLELYYENFSKHRITPQGAHATYDIKINFPPIKSYQWMWEGGKCVKNERCKGKSSMLLVSSDNSVAKARYKNFVKINGMKVDLSFWMKTVQKYEQVSVIIAWFDSEKKKISSKGFKADGSGIWQLVEFLDVEKPLKAEYFKLEFATNKNSSNIAWIDDVSVKSIPRGQELLPSGDCELSGPLTEKHLDPEIDFSQWDEGVSRALDYYHFNTLHLPELWWLGGGTFHKLTMPEWLGYYFDTPEYEKAFGNYCRKIRDHLARKGWLDEAYAYTFDEPHNGQYTFVRERFRTLHKFAPGIKIMLTEKVDRALYGAVDIWCTPTSHYEPSAAKKRLASGEEFWWYICTFPKEPYAGMFIDHPGTELRVWLWQTFKNKISGILIWETTYWTNKTRYPNTLQDPYSDVMSWSESNRPWGNGDGRFLYPPLETIGSNTDGQFILKAPIYSIRWEMLRDGVEDYEYLTILKNLLADPQAKSCKNHKAYLELIKNLDSITKTLTEFTANPTVILDHRQKVAQAIVNLLKQKNEPS